MVHIRPADRAGKMCLELFDCEMDTSIRELKQKVRFFKLLVHFIFGIQPLSCTLCRSRTTVKRPADTPCHGQHRYQTSAAACSSTLETVNPLLLPTDDSEHCCRFVA